MPLDLNDPDLVEDMAPPPILYHYTDANGFFGIVEGAGRLIATHHRYLNDTGEVEFGVNAALRVLAHLDVDDDVLRQATIRIRSLLDENTFVACLSRRHDALSQWRAYADRGSGYCIGYHVRDRLHGYGDEEDFWGNHLVECLYGEDAVEARLRERFQYGIDRIVDDDPQERNRRLVLHLHRVARRYAHVAKHEHFQEEAEWRIVVDAPKDDIMYRVTGRGLTPYRYTEDLPIVEVWIGPAVGPAPEVAKRTVKHFLGKLSIEAKVGFWESPFRR